LQNVIIQDYLQPKDSKIISGNEVKIKALEKAGFENKQISKLIGVVQLQAKEALNITDISTYLNDRIDNPALRDLYRRAEVEETVQINELTSKEAYRLINETAAFNSLIQIIILELAKLANSVGIPNMNPETLLVYIGTKSSELFYDYFRRVNLALSQKGEDTTGVAVTDAIINEAATKAAISRSLLNDRSQISTYLSENGRSKFGLTMAILTGATSLHLSKLSGEQIAGMLPDELSPEDRDKNSQLIQRALVGITRNVEFI